VPTRLVTAALRRYRYSTPMAPALAFVTAGTGIRIQAPSLTTGFHDALGTE